MNKITQNKHCPYVDIIQIIIHGVYYRVVFKRSGCVVKFFNNDVRYKNNNNYCRLVHRIRTIL